MGMIQYGQADAGENAGMVRIGPGIFKGNEADK